MRLTSNSLSSRRAPYQLGKKRLEAQCGKAGCGVAPKTRNDVVEQDDPMQGGWVAPLELCSRSELHIGLDCRATCVWVHTWCCASAPSACRPMHSWYANFAFCPAQMAKVTQTVQPPRCSIILCISSSDLYSDNESRQLYVTTLQHSTSMRLTGNSSSVAALQSGSERSS